MLVCPGSSFGQTGYSTCVVAQFVTTTTDRVASRFVIRCRTNQCTGRRVRSVGVVASAPPPLRWVFERLFHNMIAAVRDSCVATRDWAAHRVFSHRTHHRGCIRSIGWYLVAFILGSFPQNGHPSGLTTSRDRTAAPIFRFVALDLIISFFCRCENSPAAVAQFRSSAALCAFSSHAQPGSPATLYLRAWMSNPCSRIHRPEHLSQSANRQWCPSVQVAVCGAPASDSGRSPNQSRQRTGVPFSGREARSQF